MLSIFLRSRSAYTYTGCPEVKRKIFVSGWSTSSWVKKSLNHFAEFAIVNELLIIEDRRITRGRRTASTRRWLAHVGPARPAVVAPLLGTRVVYNELLTYDKFLSLKMKFWIAITLFLSLSLSHTLSLSLIISN